MKFVNLLFVTFFVLCLAYVAFAEDEAPLKRVGIHGRRPGGRGRPTSATTTTTAVPEFDEDVPFDEDEPVEAPDFEEDDSAPEQSSTTTTTPETEKKRVRGPGPSVRPFRSNSDLLDALKRRQENIKAGKKALSYKPIIKDNSLNAESKIDENADDENNKVIPSQAGTPSPLPVKLERFGRKRFGSNRAASAATKPTATTEQPEQTQPEGPEPAEEQPSETLVKRPGRSRFTYSRQYKH